MPIAVAVLVVVGLRLLGPRPAAAAPEAPAPVYMIATLSLTDEEWVPAYVADVHRQIEARGGRFLARTSRVDRVEGTQDVPHYVVIVEWPSAEAARAFLGSEAYRPYRESRQRGAATELLLVAAEHPTLQQTPSR